MNYNPKNWKVRDICLLALLTGLGVALTRLFGIRLTVAGVEGVRIGLGSIPGLLVGMIYGPIGALLKGVVGDLAGMIISPMGAYNPVFTFTSAVHSVAGGLVFYLFYKAGVNFFPNRSTFVRLLIPVATAAVVKALFGIFFTAYFIHYFYGVPYNILVYKRAVGACVDVPICVILTCLLVQYLESVPSFSRFYQLPKKN